MDCHEIEPELVGYLKDELAAAEREAVERHLAACPVCQEDLERYRQTFATLRRELTPIQLSAHFRLALAERIAAAETGKTSFKIVRSSERHRAELDKPALTYLWEHAKRSPYFAASLLVHAAAITVIVAAVFNFGQPIEQRRPQVSYTIVDDDPDAFAEMPAPGHIAYSYRKDVRKVPVTGRKLETGAVRVDVGALTMLANDTLVLVGDNTLHCVRAYFTDPASGLTAAALLSQYENSVLCKIANAELDIPPALAQASLDNLSLLVLDMQGGLEIWTQPTWQSFESKWRNSFTSREQEQWREITLRKEEDAV